MCGRFANPLTAEELASIVDAAENLVMAQGGWRPRYNAAPTQRLPVVRARQERGRRLELMAWGWKPVWMASGLLVNARGEEAAGKRTFATALRARRCLVPVQAFYEWREEDGQPFAFQRPDRAPYLIGGLWQDAATAKGETGFVLLTVAANAVVAPCHHREPLIVRREAWDSWLDPATPFDQVAALIRTSDPADLEGTPVSRAVSKVQNDGPELLVPLVA